MFKTHLGEELWGGTFRDEGIQFWSCIHVDHEPWIQISVLPAVDDPRPKGLMMSASTFAELCTAVPSTLNAFSSIDLTIPPEVSQLNGWRTYKLQELTEWVTQDGLFHWFECRTEGGVFYAGQPGELMISSPRPTLPPKTLYKASGS